MAITDRDLKRTDRNRVVFFGERPTDSESLAFKERDFIVEACSERELPNLAGIVAVIITQDTKKPLQTRDANDNLLNIEQFLSCHAKNLLDNDCQIYIRTIYGRRAIIINAIDELYRHNNLQLPTAGLLPAEEDKLKNWRHPMGENCPAFPHLRVLDETASEWVHIAQMISETPFGHAPSSSLKIVIEPDSKKNILSSSEKLLLKRAFWDCKEVHLLPMLDGLSGVLVYRAYATLPKGNRVQYFVKLGNRNEIFTEHFNYVENVRPCIPFHLGPHLVSDRCCLGADKGIIIGDFVNESESLHNCARDGRATHAIASLFNQTLSSWYLRAREDQRSIATLLADLFPKNEIPPARWARAQKLGATKNQQELLAAIKRCESTPVRVGPTHGDLHAKNVLVRTTEAIVIDFLKYSENNPLVYDAACLEVGLLVDGFAKDRRNIKALLKSIKPLYGIVHLHNLPSCDHPKNQSFWFYSCIRQIRIHARQMEYKDKENQYAAALVVALLRRACKDYKFDNREEDRRAAAYYLAEQVVLKTFGSEP